MNQGIQMVRLLSTIMFLIVLGSPAYTQTPAMFNYQGIARNTAGQPLANTMVAIRITLLDGSTNGSVLYSESRTITTNQLGIFTISIGSSGAQNVTGSIAGIDWANNIKFVKVEADPAGGNNFSLLGSTQLLSVPYALYAARTESVISGTTNTAHGYKAFASNTTGNSNTAIGANSLFTNKSGSANTAVGFNSLFENTNGVGNTALGNQSMQKNTTGFDNTAAGNFSLFSNTTGTENVAIGKYSMTGNTTGIRNVALGLQSMYGNTSGSYNVGIGYISLYGNSMTGVYNTAVGPYSLNNNSTGSSNIAVGVNALGLNTSGSFSVAVGDSSLLNNSFPSAQTTQATRNTAIGSKALFANTTGTGNTALGAMSLYYNVTGDYNTAIGYNANTSQPNLMNATAIGANAVAYQNNSVVLGSIGGYNNATVSANVGIGLPSPNAPLHIHSANSDNINGKTLMLEDNNNFPSLRFQGIGNMSNRYFNIVLEPRATDVGSPANLVIGSYSTYPVLRLQPGGSAYLAGSLTQASDVRLKKQIEPLHNVLSAIENLTGYTYYWKDSNRDSGQQIGLLAQDLQKTFPQLVTEDDKGMLSVNYIGLVPVLITGIKEQQEQIDELKKENELIKDQLKKMLVK